MFTSNSDYVYTQKIGKVFYFLMVFFFVFYVHHDKLVGFSLYFTFCSGYLIF